MSSPTTDMVAPVCPLLVSAKTAAVLCGVSRSTWLGWDSAGFCPRRIQISGRVLWATEDLKLWTRWGCPGREDFESRKLDFINRN